MSETYEDNFKARDRKRQYINRMKLLREKKIKGSSHVFDRLWRRGMRKGPRLTEVHDNREEETLASTPTVVTSPEQSIITSPTESMLHRRTTFSRTNTLTTSEPPSEPPKCPTPVAQPEEEDTHADSSYYSGILGLAGWFRALRRAHRNAVRAQNLERVVINSRRQRHRQSQYYESPFANETRALEELEAMEQDRRDREVTAQKRREMLSASSTGRSPFWWGPFERWRFKDRTVY